MLNLSWNESQDEKINTVFCVEHIIFLDCKKSNNLAG
jgi:hypothetical protein